MPSITPETEMLGQLSETKRILSALERNLQKSAPICFMVTSASHGEGKTLMAAGLSVVAGKGGLRRVLAVDLNWYAPALHNCFGLKREFDTAELSSENSLKKVVQPSGIPNLDILTAPQWDQDGNGSNLYNPEMGEGIIKQARNNYDITIIDTSPISALNRRMIDPAMISVSADGVALLVLSAVTPRQDVNRACFSLKAGGANIIGVIVNQWKNPIV